DRNRGVRAASARVEHLGVVVASRRRRRVRSLHAQKILRVDLILELQADAPRVRVELVVRRAAGYEVGIRTVGTVEEPVAVVRVAVQAYERRRADVLRVLQLEDFLTVLLLVAKRPGQRFEQSGSVRTVGEEVVVRTARPKTVDRRL